MSSINEELYLNYFSREKFIFSEKYTGTLAKFHYYCFLKGFVNNGSPNRHIFSVNVKNVVCIWYIIPNTLFMDYFTMSEKLTLALNFCQYKMGFRSSRGALIKWPGDTFLQ